MDKLKPYFPVPFAALCGLSLLHAFGAIVFQSDVALAWYGVVLCALPMLGFFAWVFHADTGRTSRYLPIQLISSWIGAGVALFDPDVFATSYALLCAAGVHGYIFWFCKLDRDASSPLVEGATLPNFTLLTTTGKTISDSDLLGSPSLLMFYRGNWCPLCVAQIGEIAAQYRELAAMGVKVLLVSPQPAKDTEELVEKFDAPMVFAIDKDLALAREWKLAHLGGVPNGIQEDEATDTVSPTLVVTDKSNRIAWVDATDNYRVRPETEVVLEVLKERAISSTSMAEA